MSKRIVTLSVNGQEHEVAVELPGGEWRKRLDAAEERFGGPGAAEPARFTANPTATFRLAPSGAALYELVTPAGAERGPA